MKPSRNDLGFTLWLAYTDGLITVTQYRKSLMQDLGMSAKKANERCLRDARFSMAAQEHGRVA